MLSLLLSSSYNQSSSSSIPRNTYGFVAFGIMIGSNNKNDDKNNQTTYMAPSSDGFNERWNIIRVINMDKEKVECRNDGCTDQAVATWALDKLPEYEWPLCEKCQFEEFGGCPDGVDLIKHSTNDYNDDGDNNDDKSLPPKTTAMNSAINNEDKAATALMAPATAGMDEFDGGTLSDETATTVKRKQGREEEEIKAATTTTKHQQQQPVVRKEMKKKDVEGRNAENNDHNEPVSNSDDKTSTAAATTAVVVDRNHRNTTRTDIAATTTIRITLAQKDQCVHFFEETMQYTQHSQLPTAGGTTSNRILLPF